MAEIRSAIIPTDRVVYTDAPLIWSELTPDEQAEYLGGVYASLELWEAAKQGDLVTAQEQHTAVLFSTGTIPIDVTLVIDGSTVDADYYFKITSYANHRHGDVFDATGGSVTLTNNVESGI